MAINITGFGPVLLKMAVHLAIAAYEDDFTPFTGEMLYYNKTNGFLTPVFYVYKLDNALWIVNRGSISGDDYLTCAEFNETTNQYGTFHLGAYEAAMYTFLQVKKYIEEFDGTVYFTGHSYGATVAPILMIIAQNAFPNKDMGAFAFGPIPMMDDVTNAKYLDKICSVVNNADLVPTLSVPNLYERLTLIVPLIKQIDIAALNKEVLTMVNLFSWFMSKELYDAIVRDVPEVTDALFGYAHGEVRLVRYSPGHVYQVYQDKPKKLSLCEIDPIKDLNKLSIYPLAMTYHPDLYYMWAVDAIPDEE